MGARDRIAAKAGIITVIIKNSYSGSAKLLAGVIDLPKGNDKAAVVKKIVSALYCADEIRMKTRIEINFLDRDIGQFVFDSQVMEISDEIFQCVVNTV